MDYYDYKVTMAEGFSKSRLFEIMDDLEGKTKGVMEAARQRLAERRVQRRWSRSTSHTCLQVGPLAVVWC